MLREAHTRPIIRKYFANLRVFLKIAFLLPSDRISGGVLVVLEHASRLKDFGIECEVVFKESAPAGAPRATADFNVAVVDYTAAKTRRYDVAVATWWETAFDVYEIPAASYAYFVQSDERRFYADWNPPAAQLVELTYRWPFNFITEASWIKDLLAREFSVNAAYAPNKICHKTFFPDAPIAQKSKLRVLVEGPGGLPFKRVEAAIRAANAVEGIELWYVATDGVVKPDWKVDRVFSTQPRSELRKIYSSCDVLLKLSTVEGFFCPPLEMMACGGTAIVSAVSGHEEYIRDGVNALVVPLDNHEAAVSALKRLKSDSALLAQLKSAGIGTAKSMRWEDSTAAFAEFLKNCAPAAALSQRETALFKAFGAVRAGVFFPSEARARFADTFSRGEAISALTSLDAQLRTHNARITELCERVEHVESGVFAKIWRALKGFREAK